MGTFSIWHWIIVLVVILLLFGAGKLSHLGEDMAKGIKAFKKGLQEEEKPVAKKSKSTKASKKTTTKKPAKKTKK